MSIIYSYPEQAPLNLNDMLIGTSSVKVGGKQKNITRNFSLKQIADFIGEGGAVFNPTASDFQIGVFNQGGTKLTGSIMSQDTFPGGTGITVAGNLTTTNNLTALGDVVLGNQQLTNNIKLLSETYLSGQIRDIGGNLGNTDQILISNNIGFVSWTDYKAGLVYQGVWNATTGRTTPDNILLQDGIGQNGQFYIVTVAGNYQLDGNPASPESPPYWQIGDWVIFVSKGNTNEWQKIDNTSALTGTGTDNKIAMWTGGATPSVTLADSIISQDAGATAVTITGTVIPTTITDKDTEVGTAGQILSSTVTGIEWIDNLTGTGTANTLSMFTGPSAIGDSAVTQSADALTVDVLTKTVTDASAYTINTNIGKLTRTGIFPGAGALTSNVTIGAQYTLGFVDIYGSDIDLRTYNASGSASSPITLWSSSTAGIGISLRTEGGSIQNLAGNYSIQATGAGAGANPEAVQIVSNTGVKFQGQGNAANINFRSYNTNLNDSGDINFISETEEGQAGNVSFSSIATDANGTAGEIRLAGAGISTSATDAVPLGLVIASNGHVKTGSVGDTYTLGSSTDGSNVKLNLDAANGTDSAVTLIGAGGLTIAQNNDIVTLTAPAGSDTTYTLAAGVKTSSSVPLNLSPSTGSDTTVNLTEGTGITLTQTSATEITIEGTAQGVTGSGTVNKLPKFGTTTSLTDSLVSEVPASSSSSYTADNTFFVEPVPQFLIMSGIRRLRWLRNQDINAFPTLTFPPNTATGTGVLVLTGDIILDADSTDVITAGTYNVDVIVGVSGGVWNAVELYFSAADWLQPTGVTGSVSYANSGAVTSLVLSAAATLAEIEIAGELNMTSNKVLNVLDPVNPQDAATKAYVDTTAAGSGALIYQTGYNAITNVPDLTTGGTGVLQGFTYAVTAGPSTTFWNPPLDTGDLLIANVDNPTTIADWTEIQSNIGIAGSGATDAATIKGISGFNSDDFDVSVNGWVEAKDFTGNTPGYVPDATSATAGTFLKEDGTWSAIAPTAGVGSYTTGNGTILSPQTTSVQLAIDPGTVSGSVFTFLNGLSIGDLVQITDGTVNGFFTYSIAGGFPNAYRFAYVSGEIPTNFSTNANVINLRNASAGVIGDISGSGNGSSVTYFTGIIGDTGVKEITSNPNIVIDSTGRFGIGTDQPSHDLDVRNVISPPIINLQDANLNSLQLQVDPLLTTINKIKSNIDLVLDVNSYDAIKIDTAANVMIGDLNNTYGSATSRLHVIEEFGTDILTLQSNTTNQKIKFTDYNQPSNDCFIGSDNGNLNVWLNYVGVSTPLFNFNKDGKLGVGTISPNYTVDIQDLNFDANLQLFSQNTGQNLILSASSSFGQDNTIDSGSGGLQFRTNGTNILNLGAGSQAGYVKFNEYGQGNKAGSGGIGVPTYSLLVDSVGEIIEGPVSSGGGTIIKESFSPFAGQTQYNLNPLGQNNPFDENYVNIYIDGVYQNLNTISSVITSGTGAAASTIVTMVSGAPAGVTVEIVSTI